MCDAAPVMSPIPLLVTRDLSMRNIWGLKINWQHYRKVKITARLHRNRVVIMSPESSSFDPVLERALVTQQGEPHLLPIVALMMRLAPTATNDNYMTVERRGISWVCDCHLSDGSPGTICCWQQVDRLTLQVRYRTITGVWLRCLSGQLASGLTKHNVFNSISNIFSCPLFPALLSHNGPK